MIQHTGKRFVKFQILDCLYLHHFSSYRVTTRTGRGIWRKIIQLQRFCLIFKQTIITDKFQGPTM